METLPEVLVTGNRIGGNFRLSSFKSKFEPVRPNLFEAHIFVNTSLKESGISDTFAFRCEQAEFPGKSISVGELAGGGGPTVKVAQDVVYNDITLTIICSDDFKERKFFNGWMNYIYKDFNYVSGNNRGLFEYYNNYAKGNSLAIYQFRPDGTLIHNAEMYEVFPTSISPMTANWDERDTYQRFTVTLAYNRMQMK